MSFRRGGKSNASYDPSGLNKKLYLHRPTIVSYTYHQNGYQCRMILQRKRGVVSCPIHACEAPPKMPRRWCDAGDFL